jgi:transcriptional regulator with XRE-family HTH domain
MAKKYPGSIIRKLRNRKKWSQRELARHCDINHGIISKLEHDKCGYTRHTLLKISESLGVKVHNLFGNNLP